ncbi:zinc finger protein [Cricetulus griseus]|uniref:Zinc finger protein n=1 Tax=Cricetulus griseus TaxID=10029 RepID=A0A061HUN8_CRIGR|nr:zinc finger protein [Cricetulus griseus]
MQSTLFLNTYDFEELHRFVSDFNKDEKHATMLQCPPLQLPEDNSLIDILTLPIIMLPPLPVLPICSVDLDPFPFSMGLFEGYLGCFQFLAITNSAAMNIVEQMSLLCECASFGYMPKSGIDGSCGRLIPIFLRSHHTDFQSGCRSRRFDWSKMVCHSCFDLYFPDGTQKLWMDVPVVIGQADQGDNTPIKLDSLVIQHMEQLQGCWGFFVSSWVPWILLCGTSWLLTQRLTFKSDGMKARTSMTIFKKYGESGQPSLVPDFRGIALRLSPFNLMLAVDLLYIAFIMLMYVPVIHDLL